MSGIMAALIGLGIILVALTLVWIISVSRRHASVMDICWGLGFGLLAWLYCFLSPALTPRAWLVAALTTLWEARLSAHIFYRHHGKGEDPRGWLTVLSPALMTFLLVRVSGATLLERSLTSSKPSYRAYIARTPPFFPWFPPCPAVTLRHIQFINASSPLEAL